MRSTDRSPLRRRLRRAALFVLSLVLVAVGWELYKMIGPADGGSILGWKLLPRANDNAMPHVSEMLSRYSRPEGRGSDRRIWSVVLAAIWFSLRLAFVGFLIGALFGLALAVIMTRFKVVERGLFPYLVVSQTVPLIALAPLVATWGGKVQIGEFVWPRWMSVAVIGAFLAFFPIAVGALKGLSSAPPASLELMDSYAASWGQTLFKLRFPAAVPYLVPAMRLAASAAVVGVVVAEISTGLRGGLGRLIIEYAREATSDPAKVYTALFGAAALGLAMAAVVAVLDLTMTRNRPKEAA
jgi:NitT/TauT family transport system permease protein